MTKSWIKWVMPLLLLVPLPAMAVDGQIPIPFAPVVATPILITVPRYSPRREAV